MEHRLQLIVHLPRPMFQFYHLQFVFSTNRQEILPKVCQYMQIWLLFLFSICLSFRKTPRAKRPARKEGDEGYDPYDIEDIEETGTYDFQQITEHI